MTEFSATGLLEMSDASLQDAEATIQSELSGIQVDASGQLASTTEGADGSGGLGAADLLDTQAERLGAQTDIVEAGVELNETRNDILREILDAQERTARSNGGRNVLRKLAGSVMGLAGGGAAIAGVLATELTNVNWLQFIGDAVPNLGPSDIVDPVALTVGNVVNSALSLSAGDVIDAGAKVGSSAVIASAATIGAGALIASKAAVTAANLIGSSASVSAGDLVASLASVSAGALISSKASISAGNLIDTAASVTPTALVANAATVTAGALIAKQAVVTIGDLVNRDGSGSSNESSSGSSNPGILDTIATSAATQGAATLDFLRGGGEFAMDNAGSIAKGVGAGLGAGGIAKALASRFPAAGGGLVLTRQQAVQGEKRARNLGSQFWSRLGVDVPDSSTSSSPSGSESRSSKRSNKARESRDASTEVTVEQSVEFETQRLERELSRLNDDLLQRIEDLEDELESLPTRGRF